MYTAVCRYRMLGEETYCFDRLFWNASQSDAHLLIDGLGQIAHAEEHKMCRLVSVTLSRGILASGFGVPGTHDFIGGGEESYGADAEYAIVRTYAVSFTCAEDARENQRTITQDTKFVAGADYAAELELLHGGMFTGHNGGLVRIAIIHPCGNLMEKDEATGEDVWMGGDEIDFMEAARAGAMSGADIFDDVELDIYDGDMEDVLDAALVNGDLLDRLVAHGETIFGTPAYTETAQ